MILKVFDEKGERELSRGPTVAAIEEAVRGLDWTTEEIVGVVLQRDEQNWADGSGSLSPNSGLSMMLEDDGAR